jgi:TonB family protein
MSTEKNPETQTTGATGTGSRPGAMTMAMNAVSVRPTGPKVLRIGIIQAGKIVEERVIRRRESVTVGSSEKNHFVIHTDGMPARFELFQLVGSDYILNFTNIMTGRVGLPGGVQDLTQMRDSGAARNAGTHYQVKLNDNSRGKVVIGNTTLLFQFVVPPTVQPRPQLPAAARAGFVRSIDWLFTAFMVFTFMSMFGFIVYLENADWPIDSGLSAVPEEVAKLIFEEPAPPPEEKPEQTVDDGKQAEAEQTKTPSKQADKPTKAEEPGPPKDTEAEAAAVAEKSARIAQEAAQAAEALIVGALSSEAGGALADVLAGGAVTGNAQDILSQAMGVGVAKSGSGGDLRQRSGGGTTGASGLGSLARKEGTTGAVGEGGQVTERTVRGSVKSSPGDEVGGSGDFDSNLVVQLIKTRLRAIQMCYEQQLRRNPSLAGKVTIEFTIQTRGNVTDVKVKENTTGDAAVGTCVANTVSTFRFNPGPEGGSVTYAYPFVFQPQN